MTIPNIITLTRIALIPIFVLAVVYYADSVKHGTASSRLHAAAVILFAVTALSDGLDGWLARKLNQRSRLGSILDPIADKALLLTALLILAWNPGDAFVPIPLWFPILVISRDVMVVLGVAVVFMMGHGFDVQPHWTGKAASGLEMATVGLILMNTPDLYWLPPLVLSMICSLVSCGIYVVQGARKLGS